MTDDEAFGGLDASDDGARVEGKRDRLARLLSVLRILQAHGDAGISPAEIARRTGMSKRSIYRDLDALQSEMQVPLWSDRGKWGVQPGAFLPPLRLTPARGDGRVPVRAARDPLRRQVRAEPRLGVREDRRGAAGRAPGARRADAGRPRPAPRGPRLQPPRDRPHPRLGGAARRALPVPAGPLRRDRARGPRGRGRALPARAVARDARAVPDRPRPDARRDPDVQGGADRRPRR